MLATVVDTSALGKVILWSLAAGIGVTAAFAVAIVGSTRFAEMRRSGRIVEAGAFGLLAVVALAAFAAAIVIGIVVMTSK
jgi:4-amino-4-deoxy-L-arabinose transferase-like glycosyltransferase